MAAVVAAVIVAERVAALAVLDLDHCGAEIAEQLPGERAGDHGGQLDELESHRECPA